MNCPVCNRNNAFNLSICPSCGAMMNDSVRAELLNKISVSKKLKMEKETPDDSTISGKINLPPAAAVKENPVQPEITLEAAAAAAAAPTVPKQTTSNLTAKPTSPTLVEFHSKNTAVPEWRVQLQNAVHKRNNRDSQPTENAAAAAVVSAAPRKAAALATSGANALKTETVRESKPARAKNPALASALERIEKSRRRFFVEAEEQPEEITNEPIAAVQPRPASKNFPFYIASKQGETSVKPVDVSAPRAVVVDNPKPVAPPRNESGDLDTNKLLAPPVAKILSGVSKPPINTPVIETKTPEKIRLEPKNIERKQVEVQSIELEQTARVEETREEFEDLAPFAMRFNAGLFDLIIGGFLSLFLLAPFMMTGGDWFSFTGLLAFLATCSIVMFIYLTTTIGFYGRTFGMRLFSLEVVDIDGESYPTLHQSAVSSAVYLLSLAFGGVGFLTLLFNDEKRAAHDLISGTIVVREN